VIVTAGELVQKPARRRADDGARGIGAMVSMLIASRKSLKYVDQRKLIAFGLIGLVLSMHSMTTWYPDMP
jgi:hypothetical protein